MALQLNHVHLKTHDPDKTAQFYVETLGATIIGKAGTNGYRLDLHGLALNVTTFLESQTREQKYGMEHIAIDSARHCAVKRGLDRLLSRGEAEAQGFPGATAYALAHEALASGMRVLDGVVRHFYDHARPDRWTLPWRGTP